MKRKDGLLRLRAAAVEFLKGKFDSNGQARILRDAIVGAWKHDPDEWWAACGGERVVDKDGRSYADFPHPFHFREGMSIRNLLRMNGYGERELGVDNLDDVYIGLIEEALGLRPTGDQPTQGEHGCSTKPPGGT